MSATASLTSVEGSSYVTPTCVTGSGFDSVLSTEKELNLKASGTTEKISGDKGITDLILTRN